MRVSFSHCNCFPQFSSSPVAVVSPIITSIPPAVGFMFLLGSQLSWSICGSLCVPPCCQALCCSPASCLLTRLLWWWCVYTCTLLPCVPVLLSSHVCDPPHSCYSQLEMEAAGLALFSLPQEGLGTTRALVKALASCFCSWDPKKCPLGWALVGLTSANTGPNLHLGPFFLCWAQETCSVSFCTQGISKHCFLPWFISPDVQVGVWILRILSLPVCAHSCFGTGIQHVQNLLLFLSPMSSPVQMKRYASLFCFGSGWCISEDVCPVHFVKSERRGLWSHVVVLRHV